MVKKNNILDVNGNEILMFSIDEDDFISLTDIMKSVEWNQKIEKWLSSRWTVEFLWAWEMMHNPNFNIDKFIDIRDESWNHTFTLSVSKRKESTNARWIIAQIGKFWWTYAHKDIAFEFASWLSPKFKLYIIKEFQRLKEEESNKQKLWWDVKRIISKANYKVHTDAIQKNLIHKNSKNPKIIYASEAELLNQVLFWMTSSEWSNKNPSKAKLWNIRDFASVEELTILSNLEVLNAEMIKSWISLNDRWKKLQEIADSQREVFWKLSTIQKLKDIEKRENAKKGILPNLS